ncbi:response regulator [Algibacter amylolyticus]|uniref:Response regulator n=1 Tax=Algibacter amylolyticus TaxID=1608400 RepID=A0A5M7B148_9FLAO|nr:response regulator [Algibacter amylolyticus]KAA5821194.1 response regulator [Algibacter amylolyticus]MBB5269841.1 CheY-like chemotaxis protein [Algibacter amylolyticus]TSJ72140.1 response regulator [Algibacter amylolyticus]
MTKTLNFCIVDDDDIYQYTIKKTIKSLDLDNSVMAFSDGEEALNFMIENLNKEDELPDIILLDINMPIMDGFQFMEEYIKIKPNLGKKITIYMVSSSVDNADLERANKISEISDYIIKPIQRGRIQTIVDNLIANQ